MCSYLREFGVIQSFSKAGVPYDNSVMESFFSSLKREELYRTKYRSEAEFRAAVDAYMVFYNERRPHAKNGYKTPMKLESIYFGEQREPETMSWTKGFRLIVFAVLRPKIQRFIKNVRKGDCSLKPWIPYKSKETKKHHWCPNLGGFRCQWCFHMASGFNSDILFQPFPPSIGRSHSDNFCPEWYW